VILFEKFQKHILSVLIGNISDHNRSSTVSFDRLEVNYVCIGLLTADSSSVSHWWWLHIVVVVFLWHCGHYGHHGHCHMNLHVCRRRSCMRSVSGRNRVGTVLSFLFGDDSHTSVHDCRDLLIFFFTVRRLFFSLLLLSPAFRLHILFPFVLEEKERIIEGVLTVGDDFSPVFSRYFKGRKGVCPFGH
jgi:hypothetical protein